jgi:hypothetical protein
MWGVSLGWRRLWRVSAPFGAGGVAREAAGVLL